MRLRIGARSSRLSQSQTSIVSSLLERSMGAELAIEVRTMKTRGDLAPPSVGGPARGADQGGAKGAFTGEIERLLLGGEIDVAVHSLKDLPSASTPGLVIGATPPRADPRDALVSGSGLQFGSLPSRARVGTSSLRRKAQLLSLRRDLEVVELHGNVDTRIRKLEEAAARLDAVVLAVAGLRRLNRESVISQAFSIEEMVPAVGQGVIAVQMRDGDEGVSRILSRIDDESTRVESACELAFARRLGADCDVPVGGCARVSAEGSITMVGMLASEDCTRVAKRTARGGSDDPQTLGTTLAETLLEAAAS